ncbi:glycoprotein-N-acetylgalactosamine 3-beta-galactosyltransferase [Aureococcus anophagefferens]|uniref:Glycoprotein-N-acetylgalactosamine 3-beta-galactosyltransferase n=1 Tax=Aureococcus anophagefferens TaxID=44056 RepID=A0ABR1G193_AURAN
MDTVVGPKMRKAWFCTFENLVFDGAKWRAFCDLTRWGRDRRYLEDLPWAFGRDVLVSSGAPPASTPKKSRPTYVAFGDCRTGNPGHCIGDWQNYRIVSRVLNESSFDAILFAGFGDGRWRGEWDAVVEPEAAVYATGALSPLGMHGPHWQVGHYLLAARARPGCRGRPPPSPVLVDVTTRADGRGRPPTFGGLVRRRVRAGAPCGASAFVFLYVLRPARRTGGDATPSGRSRTDESDETVGAVGVPHEGARGVQQHLAEDARANWRYVYEYYRDFDYFHFGGDDLFLLVSNLKAYLASPPVKARNDRGEPLFLGRRFKLNGNEKHLFNSGGSGYTFNRQQDGRG